MGHEAPPDLGETLCRCGAKVLECVRVQPHVDVVMLGQSLVLGDEDSRTVRILLDNEDVIVILTGASRPETTTTLS